MVVGSRKPLPPHAEWPQRPRELPWRPFEVEGVWTSDGQHVEPLGGHRGEVRRLPGRPEPFARSVAAFGSAPGIDSTSGIVFPVRPSPAPPAEDPEAAQDESP